MIYYKHCGPADDGGKAVVEVRKILTEDVHVLHQLN